MKIAIPLAQGQLSLHFGHCEEFALLEMDEATSKVIAETRHVPPPHEPGVLPRWLHELGADIVIAGGMGQRAQMLFAQNDIKVVVGAQAGEPAALAEALLAGSLETGDNACDH